MDTSTATRSKFAYTHDELGRRTSLTQSGDIFSGYAGGGLSTSWGYNDRSEVISSQTNFLGSSTAVLGRNFGYAYDPIGNRTSSSLDGATSSYTANSLNQYTERADPGQVVTTGLAPADSPVIVNNQVASRQGDYFAASVGVDNHSSAVWATINTASTFGGAVSRFSFIPQTPESYGYDNDGNITSDGRWRYEWDGENRLVALETRDVAYAVGTPQQRIEFRYDYLGRRVQKRVLSASGPGWNLASERRFIYDGWNVMGEADTTSGFNWTTIFVWGVDLSGSLQDAGGVGGLLWSYDIATGAQLMPVRGDQESA